MEVFKVKPLGQSLTNGMRTAAAASASRIIAGLAFVVWHLGLQKVTKSGKHTHSRADGELISHS